MLLYWPYIIWASRLMLLDLFFPVCSCLLIDSSGITTATGGFVSAASTSACKITFSGQTLTFTVAGVGATSLTLY